MNIRGFDELRVHFPDLNTTGGRLRIALSGLVIFAVTTAYFIVTDNIPTWTIDSEIVVMAIGFLIFSGFFRKRNEFIEKHRELAFRNAFVRFVVPGLAVLFAAIAHIGYMNGPKLPTGATTHIMKIAGIYWLIVGAALWVRSVMALGVDYLTMLYVYLPEKGHMVDTKIYSILRHPIYAAALRIGWGLALLNTGIYALSFMPFLLLGLFGFVRLVEEKELLQRFPNYADYRNRVPAFWPGPGDLAAFYRFLFTGK